MSIEPTAARRQAAGAAPGSGVPHPIGQYARMIASRAVPFQNPRPPAGYQRGIDFYSAAALPTVLATAAAQFLEAHGRYPDLVNPRRYTDKIFWSKFFRLIKVPQAGNKLLTSSFIPEAARDLIRCPEIVWHSPEPRVPRGNEVEPGTYYLKANLGSDRYRRVIYPISDSEADALDAEFALHLTNDYNWWRGEWWYHVFQRELLLERAIGSAEETTSWNFLVIGGEVARVSVYQKLPGGDVRKTHLSPDFEPLPVFGEPVPPDYRLPSEETLGRMVAAARAIGAPLRFVRVDFLLDDDDTLYLGEVTFTPGHGALPMHDDMDLKLGALWDLRGEPA